jgi:ABC-type multidrug transport system fused ATPase/permease subunit
VQLFEQVKKTYLLLDVRSRTRYLFLTALQIALGLLDLIAILFVGLVSYCGSAYLGISNLSDNTLRILRQFALPVDNLGKTLSYLIFIATILMILKSLFSIYLLKVIFRFLSRKDAEMSEKIAIEFLESGQNIIKSVSSQEATFAISRGLHLSQVLGSSTVITAEAGMLIILSLVIFVLNPALAFLLFFYLLVFYYLNQKKLGTWMRTNSISYSENLVLGEQVFQDGISLYKELYTKNKLGYLTSQFSIFRHKVADSSANMQLIGYIPKLTFEVALILGALLIATQQLFLGSLESSIATSLMFLTAGSRILPSILRLQSATSSIQNVSGGSEMSFRLIELIKESVNLNEKKSSPISNRLEIMEPSVQFHEVSFQYGDESIFGIKNISFEVAQETSLGIVGVTGSGKSTVVDLMLGILEPQVGSIRIGGLKPSECISVWPGAIGYVPQVVAFVNGTVRENIALGIDPSDIDDFQIWKCLKMVSLESLFENSALGLDSHVGERGLKLSGGQRQRMGIARALYSNPHILVLDEATSALDVETEREISLTIQNLAKKVTLIVVAHRLHTIQSLDQLLYFEAGRLVAKGSFQEVRSKVSSFDQQARLMGL